MISRKDRIYQQYPDPVIGYELSSYKSEFAVVIPEATENLALNPSIEGGVTTGYYAQGGANAAVATWQAYGSYGMRHTPAVSTESGVYYSTIALTAGLPYTFSVTIQGEAGKLYYVWFSTNAGALIGAKKSFRATGHKQRVFVTYNETSSASRQFHITRDAQYTDQNVFYVDGFQVEQKDHPTTYTDGTLKGYVVGETPYLWTGLPHASTSTRSAQTRSGGREVNLLDFGIRVLTVFGLGMMPLVDQSLSIPGYGELAQGRGTRAREFTLVSAIDAEAGSRQMSAILSTIYDAVKPDLTIKDQPMILRYQQLDDDGDPCGESLDILCKYQTGLEGQNDNNHSRRVGITFKQHIPYVRSTYDNGAALGYQLSVADANYIIKRDTTGLWSALSTGLSGSYPIAMVQMPDGTYIIAGLFTNAGGVANADYIAKWDGTSFTALGTGGNSAVYALAVSSDGILYAAGNFTLMGGVANTAHIAKWDGSVWTPLSTGLSDAVFAMAFRPDGVLVIGGAFLNAGGVAAADYLATWNGSAFAAVGTSTNGIVRSIAVKSDNTFYVGGDFALAGGVANTVRIAYWNGTAFTALGTGSSITGVPVVQAMLLAPDGILYAAGSFYLMGGIANTGRIAAWNGVSWSALGSGLGVGGDVIYAMTMDHKNNILVGGDFSVASGVSLPDHLAKWNGSVWMPVDADLPGSTSVETILVDRFDNLFLGFTTTGSAVTSILTTVNNPSSSSVYPTYYFTGPGKLYQTKNYSTDKSIFFDYTFLAGETAVLTLDPKNPSFVSSFRGDIWGTAILPGSQLNYFLIPGDNNISTFIYGGTTAATAVTVQFQGLWNSLDAAVWK